MVGKVKTSGNAKVKTPGSTVVNTSGGKTTTTTSGSKGTVAPKAAAPAPQQTMTNGMNNAQLANQMMATGGTASPLYKEVDAINIAAASANQNKIYYPQATGQNSYADKNGNQVAAPTGATPSMPAPQMPMPSASTPTTSNLNTSSDMSMMPPGTRPEDQPGFQSGATSPITADDIMAAVSITGIAKGIVTGLTKGIASGIAAATATTKVAQMAKVGVAPTVDLLGVELSGSTAGNIAVNSLTRAKTATWLTKLARATTNPNFVVGTVMASIGSYPFAGFIKEEALQTLGFATKTALDNDDIMGAENSQNMLKEVLNPDLWSQIKAGIPFVNVLNALDDYYEAAKLKTVIDDKVIDDMKRQQPKPKVDNTGKPVVDETGQSVQDEGETTDQRWARINQEQSDQERADIDYYNSERQKLLEWERQATIAGRDADAAFWRKEHERQSKLEAADREATAKFWTAYRKQAQKAAEDSRPSKLNFGII